MTEAVERLGGFDNVQNALEIYERTLEGLRLFDIAYPGSSDLIDLLNAEDINHPSVRPTLLRLSRHFGLKLKNPKARAAFIRAAKRRRTDFATLLRNHYLPEAIKRALATAGERQRIRLGTKWEKSKGFVVLKVPIKLPFGKFYFWFRRAVYRELDSGVDALDLADWRNFAEEDQHLYEQSDEFTGSSEGIEDLDIRETEVLSLLDSRNCELTQRELQVLELLRFLPASEIARKVGIANSTVRVFKHRLKDKILRNSK